MSDTFDLIVIGAGPGGYVASIRAAQLGMKVACIEKESLGGTCLNVGCIPSKALLDSSELFHQARNGLGAHGIVVSDVKLDLAAMMQRKDRIVQTLTRGVGGLFKKNGVTPISGTARIVDAGTVEVETAEGVRSLRAERIIVAAGSAPIELKGLPFDGKHILNSTDALSLSEVPERLIVIGGGAVGLELGSVWNRLGSTVLVVEMMEQIVPGMDTEAATALQSILEKQGITFRLKSSASAADIQDGRVRLTFSSDGETVQEECDCVLVAVGRRPSLEGIGLDKIGVERDQRGRVAVKENYETSVPGIYAIGDIIAGPMLAHKAEDEGNAAVEQMMGIGGHVNYDAIPAVVYTHPELASVGLSESAAQDRGLTIRVGKFPFRANARARCLDSMDGFVKIISDADTDRILGVHILGPRASDIISEAVIAMEFAASAEDLARSVHAHPSLPEAIKEAALAVDERPIHL